MRVVIVDYNAGNLESVRKAVYYAGIDPEISAAPEDVLAADRLILPGVGAAGRAMEKLRETGLDQALDEAVRVGGKPMLGICLGMQILADELLEFGPCRGLGWIRGSVAPVRDVVGEGPRVPHMGWNSVAPRNGGEAMFRSLKGRRDFYFSHSYTLRPKDDSVIAATVDYGTPLVAAVIWQTVFATQFHPEKSQDNGERLLAAFFDWKP